MGAVQENPLTAAEEPASEQEQADYEDLWLRLMSAVNDTKESKNGRPLAQAVVEMLGVKGQPAHEAIGRLAGIIMSQMIDLAKRAGREYDGRAIQEAGLDLVTELMDIAKTSGAIENMPEEDSPEWAKLAELSALEASKQYGEWLLRTGQADREGHLREIQGQMQREADSGELDNWGMEQMDPQLRDRIAQQVQAQAPQGQPPQGGM